MHNEGKGEERQGLFCTNKKGWNERHMGAKREEREGKKE